MRVHIFLLSFVISIIFCGSIDLGQGQSGEGANGLELSPFTSPELDPMLNKLIIGKKKEGFDFNAKVAEGPKIGIGGAGRTSLVM